MSQRALTLFHHQPFSDSTWSCSCTLSKPFSLKSAADFMWGPLTVLCFGKHSSGCCSEPLHVRYQTHDARVHKSHRATRQLWGPKVGDGSVCLQPPGHPRDWEEWAELWLQPRHHPPAAVRRRPVPPAERHSLRPHGPNISRHLQVRDHTHTHTHTSHQRNHRSGSLNRENRLLIGSFSSFRDSLQVSVRGRQLHLHQMVFSCLKYKMIKFCVNIVQKAQNKT